MAKRHHSRVTEPRGLARNGIRRTITTANGNEVLGTKAFCIAYVNGASPRARQQFEYLCGKFGANYKVLQTWDNATGEYDGIPDGEFVIAVELWGTPKALNAITARPCVREHHDAMEIRVPFIASGAGPEKSRSISKPFGANRKREPIQAPPVPSHLHAPYVESVKDMDYCDADGGGI